MRDKFLNGDIAFDMIDEVLGVDKDNDDEVEKTSRAEPHRALDDHAAIPALPADLGSMTARRAAMVLALWNHAVSSMVVKNAYPPRSDTIVATARTFYDYLADDPDAPRREDA